MQKIRHVFLGFALVLLMGYVQAQNLPKNAQLTYTGPMGLAAVMDFQSTDNAYALETVFHIPLYPMQFRSQGLLEHGILKPLSYQDTRKGKPYAQATFDYQQNQIVFGKHKQMQSTPIHGAPLDIFSLAWQLGLNHGKMADTLQFTNGKKVYENLSILISQDDEQYTLGNQQYKMMAYHFDQGQSHYQYKILPGLYHIPAVIYFQDDSNTYELKLKSAVINGKKY